MARIASHDTYRRLEDVIGCKWSVSVLLAIGEGVARPGAMQRHIEGISAKVLAERLRKLTAYRLIAKERFPEVPPRTEYSLTSSGTSLLRILEQVRSLDARLSDAGPTPSCGSASCPDSM